MKNNLKEILHNIKMLDMWLWSTIYEFEPKAEDIEHAREKLDEIRQLLTSNPTHEA